MSLQPALMSPRIATYLDSNAGAPLHPRVIEALQSFFQSPLSSLIANPSSIHLHGRQAKSAVADAREKIAASLGKKTDPEQLIFTSSGSEANQLAIRSVLMKSLRSGHKPHWIPNVESSD